MTGSGHIMGRGIKISRRAVLTGLGAGGVDKAFAGRHLEITGTDDGGFVVFVDFREAWHVSGDVIKQAWGDAATAVIGPANATPSILISGFLLGKTAKVEISFSPRLTAWACRLDLQLQTLGNIQTEVRFPFLGSAEASTISIPVSAAPWRRAVGLPAGTAILHPRLKLNRQTLAPTLSGPFVFEDLGSFRATGPLDLLPATEKGSPIARLKFRPSEILNLAEGWSIDADSMQASFPASKPNYLVLEGEGILQIGRTRFSATKDSSIQCFREGSHAWAWKVDWHLPNHEQVIDTPHGRFNVVGTGGTDVSAQGTSRRVQRYLGSAQLRHAAFRLPLEGKGQDYADLGRIDFDNAKSSQVSFKIVRLGKPAEESWISLDSDDPTPVNLQLDSARLRVATHADLFRGCFRFTGIALRKTKIGLFLQKSPLPLTADCLLRVELPPQHVREQSFARQLPILPGGQLMADELPMLFNLSGRQTLQAKLLSQPDPSFKEFVTKYRDKYTSYHGTILSRPSASTQALEEIYVGPDGLISLFGRRLANELAFEIRQQNGVKIADIPLGLGPITVGDILQRHRPPQPPWTPATAQPAFAELLAEAAKRSDDQSLLQNWYSKNNPATGLFYVVEWLTKWPNEFPVGSPTRIDLKNMLDVIKVAKVPPSDGAQPILDAAYQDASPSTFPVKRQAAGATRLVFDMGSKRDTSWPYCLETLMSWSDLQLKVIQRAMRFDVDAGSSEGGLIDALTKQKIPPTVTIDKRLTAVFDQANVTPSEWDTRIELPSRLYLSPASDAWFRPSRPPLASKRRVPIWQAELRERPGKSYTLRAVGSPDFNPAVFKPLSKRTEGDKAPLRGGDDFQSSLDGYDRHQLVALSSVYGLPAIARQSDEGLAQTSQISPPQGYRLTDLLSPDLNEQALYIPRGLPFGKLNLSPIGASLDLDALFVPPASVRDSNQYNLYDAFSLERFHAEIAFGRDVTIEVVYKGFLYPIGFRATLVKLTERFYLPWPEAKPRLPAALLRQRLFIQISNPTKTFPAVNQPFQGRGWPAQAMTLDMDRTPDLINPVSYGDKRSDQATWSEQSSGRLDHQSRVGLVFWPRTTPGVAGNIPFRMRIDDRLEPVSMPMIFIDNDAAHDATTMRLLRDHYNNQVPQDLRQIEHSGVRRRYAPEEKPGDTTFETLRWIVAADARDNGGVVKPTDTNIDNAYFLVDSSMESVDQPPVYPRLASGQIRHDSSARFTGNAQRPTTVTYYDTYLSKNFGSREPGVPNRDLGKQAFLIVSDTNTPSLSMGGNGDRSGGVGRPNLPIRAIGRDGPIGSRDPLISTQSLPTFGKGFKFFDDDALVLGIVSMNALVDSADIDTALPPVLRDTFEFACNLIRKVAYAARLELNKVRLCEIERLPDPLKGAYGSLLASLNDLDAALAPLAPALDGKPLQCETLNTALVPSDKDANDDTPCNPQVVAQVLVKARNLFGELDKLAAAPLAPLMQIVSTQISAATVRLSNDIMNSVEQPFANLVAGIQIDALSDVLLPVGEALPLVDNFQDLVSIKPAIIRAFDDATKDTFAEALPPTLGGLRDRWVQNTTTRLDALRSTQPLVVVTAIAGLETGLQSFGTTPPPAVLNDLYETAFALRTAGKQFFDPTTLKKLLSQELKDELLSWWSKSAAPQCVEVLNAFKSIRMSLIANAFDPGVCNVPDLCVAGKTIPSGATGGLCLLLWQVCQDAPSLSPASIKLAATYAALASATADLVNIEIGAASKCSDPANFNQIRHELTRNLQKLGAAKLRFVESLTTWAGDLVLAAQTQLTQAAASRVGATASKALSVLTPTASDIADFVDNLTPLVGSDTATTLKQELDATIAAFSTQQKAFSDAATPDDLRKAADGLKGAIATISAQASQTAETAIAQATLRAALPPIAAADANVTQLLQELDTGYAAVKQTRDTLRDGPNGLEALQYQLTALGISITGTPLTTILNVDKLEPTQDSKLRAVCSGTPNLAEGLDQEQAVIHCMAALSPGFGRMAALVNLFDLWSNKPPALIRLVTELSLRTKTVMTLPPQINFVDVTSLRQALSELIQDAIPSKRHLEYSWDLHLNEGSPIPIGTGALASFLLPDKLTLKADTDIDLLQINQTPKFQVSGTLGGFGVDIWQKAVVLKFHPFSFTAGSGTSPHFSANLSGVKIGAALAFLTALEVYFQAQSGDPSGGDADGLLPNGPYIIPRVAGPGLTAGYRLALGDVELGNLAIFGLTFDAHCEMPFDGAKGVVKVGLASPEAPFLITFAPYGGRGHFVLETGPNPGGAQFDVGFQYGGAVAIQFGPLHGSAFVMIGFRVQKTGTTLEFSGFFIAAFEGQVACFGVAVCFSVTMFYRSVAGGSNQMIGEAQLSFEFSCGPLKVKYQIRVNHSSGGGMGQSAWLEPLSDQPRIILVDFETAPAAVATSSIPSLLEDWPNYRARYDFTVRAAGRRRRK
jgi:hypothetical protein